MQRLLEQLEAQLAQAQRAAAVADRQVPFVALIFQLLLPSVIMMLYHMRHYKQIFRNGHGLMLCRQRLGKYLCHQACRRVVSLHSSAWISNCGQAACSCSGTDGIAMHT